MRSIIKNTFNVSVMTFISRILGFIRDAVIARYFGATMGADAFFVAFKIPNFFRGVFSEGAFSQAFIPVLAKYKESGGIAAVKLLSGSIFFRLGLIVFIITLLGIFGAQVWMHVFAPGFVNQPEKFALATQMLRIIFPYLMLISLVALSSAIMNVYQKFAVPAFTPVFFNLVLIGFAVWLSPLLDVPIIALAWGVLVAGVVQLFFHLPFLWKLGLLPKPIVFSHPGVSEVRNLIIPALLGVSVAQINLLVDTILASFLATGSVSWLYYSERLMGFPLGVFGVAMATVMLPGLSSKAAKNDWVGFQSDLDFALKTVFIITIPATLGLVILSSPMIITLFNYGAFTEIDVIKSSDSLKAYSLGLVGFILIKILAPAFYARKNMKTPVRVAIISLVANIILNLILILPLAHVGLALATSISAFINAGLLYYYLLREGGFKPQSGWSSIFTAGLTASIALVVWLMFWLPEYKQWFEFSAIERSSWLMGLVASSLVVYCAVLILMGLRPKHFR